MKTRQGFVSNSSSASFIICIPSTDRDSIITNLFKQFEHDYFGKYYIKEAIQKRHSFFEKRLTEATEEYQKLSKIPKEERLSGTSNNYDPLEWKESNLKGCQNAYDQENKHLKDLEEIDDASEKELVEFGLRYYGIGFSPTYSKKNKIDKKKLEEPENKHYIEQYDSDATDDSDLDMEIEEHTEEDIIGYQLSDWVTMFNDYGDMPKILRNLTGVLAFVYSDLKCWVEEDDY